MKIGILGAGYVAKAIAELGIHHGHEVMISNSRGPQTLTSAVADLHCLAGTVEDAAHFGEMVIVAVPFNAYESLPATPLAGKVVVDAMNYYPERDGKFASLDSHQLTTSELVQGHLPGVLLVKAFNSIRMRDLLQQGRPAGATGRLALPLAGDHDSAKLQASGLYEEFGFTALDVGSLKEGFRFENGTPAYCQLCEPEQLWKLLMQPVKA